LEQFELIPLRKGNFNQECTCTCSQLSCGSGVYYECVSVVATYFWHEQSTQLMFLFMGVLCMLYL